MSYLYMSFTLYPPGVPNASCEYTSHPTCVHYLNIDLRGGGEPPNNHTSNHIKYHETEESASHIQFLKFFFATKTSNCGNKRLL